MSNFEQLARFVPLADNNAPALALDQVKDMAPEDFEFKQPQIGQLFDAKEFYEYEMTLKNGKPLVFMLRGSELELGVNNMSGKERVEFKLNLQGNGAAQHTLWLLSEYIHDNIKQQYDQDIVVKSPVYKLVASLPWVHSYGKNGDIEVKSRHSIFSCSLAVNVEALKRVIANNAGGEFELRVVLKSWLLREKVTGILKAGYKLHVQQVVAL
jgi:hypothetical protein